MGNPRCQGDRVRLAIERTIPSPSSKSAGCKIANRTAGVLASRWASAANAELHQLECVVPGDAPS